tara:strand:- start:374 stop:1060 length:687 start_codon:yes stop_codon:yes gene_type:complete
MNKIFAGLVFSILIIISSCEPVVVFKTPQPKGITEVSSFSPEFRGTFFCESDSGLVVVDENIIYKTHWFNFSIPENRIESDPDLEKSGESLMVKDLGKCMTYKIQNDTVYASIRLADTLFMLSEENILKSYKGHQVMNLKLKDDDYEVIILSLDEDSNLELKMATLPREVEELEKITSVKDVSYDDIEQYQVNPTQLEFDEILKQEIVFETCEYFMRVKIPMKDLYPF